MRMHTSQYSFPIIDTTGGRLVISAFPLAYNQKSTTIEGEVDLSFDRYDEIYTCLQLLGMDGCLHLTETWYNESL